jgi:hypothetical protein
MMHILKEQKVSISIMGSLLLMVISFSAHAQILTPNDGFEGNVVQNNVPPNWNNCNDGLSTGDTQPGCFHNTKPASQGHTYITLVTRELNPPGTAETAWANLLIPFEKDKCYHFSIDLTLSNEFLASLNFDDYYFNNPCILQVFGFNGDCNSPQSRELLWTSDVVDYFNWKTNNISVKPLLDTYHKIALRPYFVPEFNFKNAALLIDNLQFKLSSNVFIHENGLLSLPATASGIQWYFNDQLIPGENTVQMPYIGNGSYKASFFDENGCLIITSEYFSIDTDSYSIYPNPTTNFVTLESFSTDNGNFQVYLYDNLGRIVIDKEYATHRGKNKMIFDFRNLATGLYHLKVLRNNLATVDTKLIIMSDY